MKRLLILAIGVLFAGQSWALTYMGSPSSNVKQGDFLLGFDYSESKSDVEISGYGLRGTLEEVKSDLYMGKFGFGISDGFEFFGHLGSSEIENLGNEFAWGVGTKATLGRKDDISLGALFQLTALTCEETEYFYGYLLNGEIDIYEFQVAIGPRYDMDGLYIYGGPFIHFIEGDIEGKIVSRYGTLSGALDIEQESEFGGFIGMGVQLGENISLSIEYQATSDAEALGIGLLFGFSGPSKPEKRTITTYKPTTKLKTGPEVDASGRKIKGYKVKRDASGEIMKDEDGNFIFIPVYEDKQEK